MKVSINWLQTYFDAPLPSAEKIADGITMHSFEIEEIAKVGADYVLDVKVLPNRAHDCLSHYGLAKEISTIFDIPLSKIPFAQVPVFATTSTKLKIKLNTPKVKRFTTASIENVVVGPSPAWLKERLESIGQKSINNVVDATNFVMFDLGQPMHAFNVEQLKVEESTVAISVRESVDGETTKTLGGADRSIPSGSILITDGHTGGETVLGIAGIKGGAHAEITSQTKHIVLEAATFDAETIRQSSKLLRLRTDASARFENTIAPELAGYALEACTKLILEIASGPETTVEGYVDMYPVKQETFEVDVTLTDINKVLGTALVVSEVEKILKRLNLPFAHDNEIFKVIPPFERLDITIKEDAIEEIGRIYGLEHIPTQFPESFKIVPKVNKNFYYSFKIREALSSLGFSEVYTYALQSVGEVEIENPLAIDKKFLRHTLATGLGRSLELNVRNAPLFGLTDVKIFEIGKVFQKGEELLSLGIAIGAVTTKKSKVAEELTKAREALESKLEVSIKTVDVNDTIFLIDLSDLIDSLPEKDSYDSCTVPGEVKYRASSNYPFALRDIALFVPENVESAEVANVIAKKAGELLVRLDLFDVFKKEGRVSYAFRLVFQSLEKTLSDDEVNKVMEKVTVTLISESGWQVR